MTPQGCALSKMVWKEAIPDLLSFYFLLLGDLELWYNLKIQLVVKELKDQKRLCDLSWSIKFFLELFWSSIILH